VSRARTNNFGNHGSALFSVTSSSRKEVIADVAGLFSLNLRGRSAGIVPVEWMPGARDFREARKELLDLYGSWKSIQNPGDKGAACRQKGILSVLDGSGRVKIPTSTFRGQMN
jgi:hypothetical protein